MAGAVIATIPVLLLLGLKISCGWVDFRQCEIESVNTV